MCFSDWFVASAIKFIVEFLALSWFEVWRAKSSLFLASLKNLLGDDHLQDVMCGFWSFSEPPRLRTTSFLNIVLVVVVATTTVWGHIKLNSFLLTSAAFVLPNSSFGLLTFEVECEISVFLVSFTPHHENSTFLIPASRGNKAWVTWISKRFENLSVHIRWMYYLLVGKEMEFAARNLRSRGHLRSHSLRFRRRSYRQPQSIPEHSLAVFNAGKRTTHESTLSGSSSLLAFPEEVVLSAAAESGSTTAIWNHKKAHSGVK